MINFMLSHDTISTSDFVTTILLLIAMPLYFRFYSKIGHQVGLGYKVQRSRFKVKRFALFPLPIDSIGLIP
jgi:hypothetical protein